MLRVGGDRVVDVPVAELSERVTFPRFPLASVFGESDRRDAFTETTEEPSGVDLGKLARIADEHDLGVRGRGVVEHSCELASADHSRFVDDKDRVGREGSAFAMIEVGEKTGDGVARNAGGGFEFGGGASGERGSDDEMSGALPGVAGGVEAEGLAGSRRGDHDVDRTSRGGERGDHLAVVRPRASAAT